MKKMLELTDAISMFQNGMQTYTKEIVRTGRIGGAGITFEFLDSMGDEIFVTCRIDGMTTSILMTKEDRLPYGDTRTQIKDNGLDFLFQDCSNPKPSKWNLSFDLNDDDNNTKYELKNKFFDHYSEIPVRNLFPKEGMDAKFNLYFPIEGKTKNVDGMAVFEVGNDLEENSGIVNYYNFRVILETDTKYL
jgi:hypothetical protein